MVTRALLLRRLATPRLEAISSMLRKEVGHGNYAVVSVDGFLSVLKGIVQCFLIRFIFNVVAKGSINLSSLVVFAFCGRQYVACLNYGSLIVLCLARAF